MSTGCIIPEPVRLGLDHLVLHAQNMLEGHGSWLIGSGPGSAAHKPVAVGTQCLLCSQLLSSKGSSQLPPRERREPQPVAVSGELLPLVQLTQHEWAHALRKQLYLISASSFNVTRGKYHSHGKCYKEEVLDITQLNLVRNLLG